MRDYFGGTTGERIEDLLRERRISQDKLARAVYVSPATMNRYIRGTSDIPGTVLIAIARYFDVTTDYLLGAADIPFKTGYDLDRLGLTKDAALKLLSGDVEMSVLNTLLASDDFATLTRQIAAYVRDTDNECLAVMSKVMEIAGGIVQKHAKTHPQDKENAIRAYRDIRSHMVEPRLPDTAPMESTWARILADLRAGAADRVKKSPRLTSDVMEGIVAALEKRKGTFDLHKVTVQDITNAIVEVTAVSDYPEEEKAQVEKALRELFEKFARAEGGRRRR